MDNWIHRSKGMQCRTCMWYVDKMINKKTMRGEQNIPSGIGRCRKHSPTLNGWPAIYPTDWCGDHKLDEQKMEVIR